MRCCSTELSVHRGFVYVEALLVLPLLVIVLSGVVSMAVHARARLAAERFWQAVVLVPRNGSHDDWLRRVRRLAMHEGGSCEWDSQKLQCTLPVNGVLTARTWPGGAEAEVAFCALMDRCARRRHRWIGLGAPGGIW